MATSGWNRPSANKPITPRKNNSVAKGLVAGLIVVIVAAIAAYFIFSSAPERKPTIEQREMKHDHGATVLPTVTNRVEKPEPEANQVAEAEPEKPVFTDGRTSEWSKQFSKDSKWTATTNSFGQQIEIVYDGGKRHDRISWAKPPMVNNAADQMLAVLTSGGGEGPLPPMPVHPQAEKIFRESLDQEIIINDDDPYEIKLRKADIINARGEMKKLLDAGETFESVVRQTLEQRNSDYSLRQEARSSVANMAKDDPDGAAELMSRYNEVLRNNGISELTEEEFTPKTPGKKEDRQ